MGLKEDLEKINFSEDNKPNKVFEEAKEFVREEMAKNPPKHAYIKQEHA